MTEPTDDELETLARKHGATSYRNRTDTQHPAYGFTENGLRNLLADAVAKWGTPPAVAGEPVGEVQHLHELNDEWLSKLPIGTKLYTTPQPTQAQAGAVPLTESEMGEGWRRFQETLDDRMAADPAGVRSMGREHWLSWAHWKAACSFALGIKGGQHG